MEPPICIHMSYDIYTSWSQFLHFSRFFLVFQAVSADPDGRFLHQAPAHIAGDREVILAAVQRNGRALEFAAETLRADKETLW